MRPSRVPATAGRELSPLAARSRARAWAGACLLLAVLGTGCAGVRYGVAHTKEQEGIRYYRPGTYVLITPDYETGSAKVDLWQGPDTRQAYLISPYSFLAKNKTEVVFENGMLSKVESESESSKVAADTVGAISTIAQKTLEAAAAQAKVVAAAAASMGVAQQAGTTDDVPPIWLFMVTHDGSLLQLFGPSVKEGGKLS